MLKKFLFFFLLCSFLIFSNPVHSKVISTNSIDKYIKKISNKFSRTYCNTLQFGISNDGALAFAIGETNKEFKNNNLNDVIDYSVLKNEIVKNLDINCQVYDFPTDKLDKLKF